MLASHARQRCTERASNIMAGTRTAPAVTGAISGNTATIHAIDASGDLYTDSITKVAAITPALIEAWVAAYQAATQASVYKVTLTNEWAGDPDPDNAEALYRGTVKEGVNKLYRNATTLDSTTPRLVAPIGAVMQGNQDIPLLTATEMTALITAELAILTGYLLTSAQFTGRRERTNNPRIKA